MKYEVLDTTNFEDLFANALHMWKQQSNNEEVHPSDVSYTLMEMMAMLTDMLNYYMEQITPEHIDAYQQLQKETTKISCNLPVILKNKKSVQKGDVFYLHRDQSYLPFEVQETMNILPGEIRAIFYHREQDYHKIDHLLRQEEGIFTFPVNHDGELIFLTSHAFDRGSTYSIYVTCREQRQHEATYEKPSFAKWEVAIYTKQGWKTGTILEDETCGFLYSGFLTFRFLHQQTPISYIYEQAYVFRLTYTHARYDQMPVLHCIQLSAIKVKQQEHLTRSYEFQCNHKNDIFIIEDDLIGMKMLALREDKRRADLYHPIKCNLLKKQFHSEVHFISPYYPVHILMVCSHEHTLEQLYTGVTSQKIPLVHGDVDNLLLKTSRGYQKITCYSKSDQSTYGYGCWKLHDALRFGNGRDFKVMEKGSLLYQNLVTYRCEKAPKNILSESDIEFLNPYHVDQKSLVDVIQTKTELEFTILHLPHLAIEKVFIEPLHTGICKVYVKSSTGYYPNWYFSYIKAEIDHRLPIGIKVDVYPMKHSL